MPRQLALLLVAITLGATSPTHHYRIDEAASTVSAKVGFLGLASKTARFPKMSGGIALRPDRLENIDLSVVLDATALTAGDATTLKRLKGKDFFDVDNYPTVTYSGHKMTMTGATTATIDGDLTARGVTKPTVLQVAFTAPPAQATGHDPVQLVARTTINRYDFGMKAYGAIVGKKVNIAINVRMVPS